MSAKFHGLVLFGLQVTLFEFKEEEEEEDEEFWCLWENRHFLFNPFPMLVFAQYFGQWCNLKS